MYNNKFVKIPSDSLKLIANDSETIHFLSALIQDSISCTTWFLFKNNTLKILLNRVCWEKPREEFDGNKYIPRLHSILSISNVEKIMTKNLTKKKIDFFSILSLSCIEDEKTGLNKIIFTFSKGTVHIFVKNFSITMKDVSTYWLSSQNPEHQHNIKNNIKE